MSTPFVTRQQWGARPARSTPARINNEGQTLHYGGGSPWGAGVDRSSPERFAATADHARCATILRAWQSYHMSPGWAGTKNGAADLAYNSAVCPHGYRYEGRGVGRRSAGQGTNAGNSRSCATVYIAGAGDPLTDEAKLGFLDEATRFGTILRWNHGDWKNTACAGPAIRAWQAAGFPHPDPDPDPDPLPPTDPEEYDMNHDYIIQHPTGAAVLVRHFDGRLIGIKDAKTLKNFQNAGMASVPVDDGTWQEFHRAAP